MKNILISGYYGFANTGDEAVLSAMLGYLRANFPGVRLTVLSASPTETAAAYGVEAVDRWKISAIFRAMRHCDIFVSGGGSLFQDVTGKNSLRYYLGLITIARLHFKKVFIYAQGVGPLNEKRSRKMVARSLKRCRFITLRDEDSAALLCELGVPERKMAVTADPVLGWQPDTLPTLLPAGLKMGFALRNWRGFDHIVMARVADSFAEKGWSIVFLPFHDPDDIIVSKLVAGAMKQPSFVSDKVVSPEEMMSAVSCCQMIVASRLHALIMAAATATPFAALSYDPKIDGFCRFVGQTVAADVAEQDAEKIRLAVEAAVAKKGEQRQYMRDSKPHWADLCHANAALLRECAYGAKDLQLDKFLPAADKSPFFDSKKDELTEESAEQE